MRLLRLIAMLLFLTVLGCCVAIIILKAILFVIIGALALFGVHVLVENAGLYDD